MRSFQKYASVIGVIPAKLVLDPDRGAGIQCLSQDDYCLDSRLHGNDSLEKSTIGLTRLEVAILIAVALIIAAVIFVSLRLAQGDARNARRLSDVRQILAALEFFRNDNGRYPAVLAGRPTGGNPAFDTYLLWPSSPLPPDGACTAQQNTYTYTPLGSPANSYTLSFCLGRATDDVPAEVRTASPSGIK